MSSDANAKKKPSILDGMPTTEEEMQKSLEFAGTAYEHFLENSEFGQKLKDSHVLKLMREEGLTLAEAIDMPKEQLEAVYALGHQQLVAGDSKKALDTFMQLIQFDPMDERYIYCLGVACQMNGEYAKAAKVFVQFLARDATNPEGYLRLGECFMHAGELENAREVFDLAGAMAEDKPQHSDVLPYVQSMLSNIDAQIAANSG